MKVTDEGRKFIQEDQFKSTLLTWATEHFHFHGMSQQDCEDSLRLIVARHLAMVQGKHGPRLPTGSELDNLEDFEKENAPLIEPLVQEAMKGAIDPKGLTDERATTQS